MNGDFIKTARNSQLADFIIRKRPTAFVLLYLIAKRAKRTNDHPDKSLEIGEAEIGDYESYGVTRQVYRTDLEWLVTNQLVTTKSTNKGTIVKLVNYEVFDINAEQPTTKLTRNQPTTNQQLTTNKNDKNEKKLSTNVDNDEHHGAIGYGNERVDYIISTFKGFTGRLPVDKRVRNEAWALAQRVNSFNKARGKGTSMETFKRVVQQLFTKLSERDYFQNIEKLEPIRLRAISLFDQALELQRSKNAEN